MGTKTINGLKVVDAKKSILILVSPKDIQAAKRRDQGECAAAIACKRQLKATDALVHLGRTYVRYNGHWERYITPRNLRDELIAFDRGGRFEPGDYTLIKMQPSRKNDKSRDKRKVRKYKKHLLKPVILANVRPTGIYA